jgi:plasmid stability protein
MTAGLLPRRRPVFSVLAADGREIEPRHHHSRSVAKHGRVYLRRAAPMRTTIGGLVE